MKGSRQFWITALLLILLARPAAGQLDCNENGLPDDEDIATGRSIDCNGNNVPDKCEIAATSRSAGGPFFCTAACLPDCNLNGILDECELPTCQTVDVVFLIDSSDSTEFEINGPDGLCAKITAALNAVDPGITVNEEILLIGPGGNTCDCCTDFVEAVFCDVAIGHPEIPQLGTCTNGGGDLED